MLTTMNDLSGDGITVNGVIGDESFLISLLVKQPVGPGMDEVACKRVLEPFVKTKPMGVSAGLGLRVSIFAITENHGDEMAVESFLGSGAKFIIRLPVDSREA